MIHFERSFDYELIRRVLTHPRIWPHISDDGSPAREEYRPVEHAAVWYVVVRDIREDGDDLLGLWCFAPTNAVCWDAHFSMLPLAWGERGQLAARLMPAWIWANTPCRRIISIVPSTNRLALNFALKTGMRVYGVNEASFLKNGALCDQVCFGISAPVTPMVAEVEQMEDICLGQR